MLLSALAVLHGSLRKAHTVVTSLVFEKMVLAREAILALARTVFHVAVNEVDLVSRQVVPVDICFAREGGIAAFPGACSPFGVVSEMLSGQAHVSGRHAIPLGGA